MQEAQAVHKVCEGRRQTLHYQSSDPRASRSSLQLTFCRELYDDLIMQCPDESRVFLKPIIHLHNGTVVRSPIDLVTIKAKLDNDGYSTAQEFGRDMRLIFTSCYKYSSKQGQLVNQAKYLQHVFEVKFSRLPEEDSAEHLTSDRPPHTKCCAARRGRKRKHEDVKPVLDTADTDSESDLSDEDVDRLEKIQRLQRQAAAYQQEFFALINAGLKRKHRVNKSGRKAASYPVPDSTNRHVTEGESRRRWEMSPGKPQLASVQSGKSKFPCVSATLRLPSAAYANAKLASSVSANANAASDEVRLLSAGPARAKVSRAEVGKDRPDSSGDRDVFVGRSLSDSTTSESSDVSVD